MKKESGNELKSAVLGKILRTALIDMNLLDDDTELPEPYFSTTGASLSRYYFKLVQ